MTNPSYHNFFRKELSEIEDMIPYGYLSRRRIFEILVIAAFAPLLLFMLLIITLCILLLDSGPVFYLQKRPGKNGKLFSMYKFRTMIPNSDDRLLTTVNDIRVTSVGAILRRYKLDELPQLLNVLKGEMSIIGPGPVPEKFYYLYLKEIPFYPVRHLIRPGITGLAQVRLGYTGTLEEEKQKVLIDLEYIKNIQYLGDIRIIWDTLILMFRLNS